MSFTIDRLSQLNATGRFAGHLDLQRTGAIGHSFGGAQAAELCIKDARCRCGVDIDGMLLGDVVQTGLRVPFLFLLSDHRREPVAETRPVLGAFESVFNRLPTDGRAWLEIGGGNHFLFSDDGAVFKSRIVIGALRLFGLVRIDPARQQEITRECLRRFLDSHLKGDGTFDPAKLVHTYPELSARHVRRADP